VKRFLLSRDGNNCSWCEKTFGETQIVHHICYDHSCSFNKEVIVTRPTLKRPNRTASVPDCETCSLDNFERFNVCMSKLVLVHPICNKIVSYKAIVAQKVDKAYESQRKGK
jgi:hypothetical protein